MEFIDNNESIENIEGTEGTEETEETEENNENKDDNKPLTLEEQEIENLKLSLEIHNKLYEKYKLNLFFQQKEVNKKIALIYYAKIYQENQDILKFLKDFVLDEIRVKNVKGIPDCRFYKKQEIEILFEKNPIDRYSKYRIRYFYIDNIEKIKENVLLYRSSIMVDLEKEKEKSKKECLIKLCKNIFKNSSKYLSYEYK